MKYLKAILISLITFLFVSCGDSSVDLIKESVLPQYPNSTLGNSLEATFASTDWSSDTNDRGVTTVTFTGEISDETNLRCLSKFEGQTAYQLRKSATRGVYNERYRNWLAKLAHEEMGLTLTGEEAKKMIENRGYHQGKSPDAEAFKALSTRLKAEYESARKVCEEEVYQEFLENYWKAGEEITISFVVNADGTDWEFGEYAGDSWARYGITWSKVLRVIYGE